ncbi:MAG: hypothetical protein HYR96_10265, partial [Deltaproteobacteria bacterium]|nr:hypothetical protein [Deltaproteobacteria bacterium]
MKFFQLIPSGTNINFIGKFKLFMILSTAANILVISGIVTKGFNYGIDFTGGTAFQVRFTEARTAEQVRDTLTSMGDTDASVVALGTTNTEYMITSRTDKSEQESLHKRFVDKIGPDNIHVQQVDIVGPKVGKELRTSALLSLIYSVLLIMVYIWFRFDAQFAPGA